MAIPTPVEFWTKNNTLVGAVSGLTLTSEDNADHYVDPGKIGQAWDFAADAARSLYLDAGAPNPGAADFSISFWFRLTDIANHTSYLLCVRDPNDSGQVILVRIVLGTLSSNLTFSGTTARSKTLPAKDTNWHHGCIVRTAGVSLVLYVDGVAASFADQTINTAATAQLRIGADRFVTSGFRGEIDAIGWWNVPLSPTEVSEVYNAGAGWEYVAVDNTPDPFDFADITAVDLATLTQSNLQIIQNCDTGTPITVEAGLEYRLDGGEWTSDAGVTSGVPQMIDLRMTSSDQPETTITKSVTVGTLSVNWSVTTEAAMTVITNIIGGSPTTSRIVRSRIVQGIV